MSSNPVYAFFATPKSLGPLVLRLLLAAVFAWHGWQKILGGSDLSAEDLGMAAWTFTGLGVAELVAAFGLFVGLLTRLCALTIVAVMTGAITLVHAAQGLAACEYPATLLAAALALVFLGGGRFSMDRAVSGQLLPTVG